MKNWKTTLTGLFLIAAYSIGKFFPDYASFVDGLFPILVGAGFLASKDNDVTGGKREQ